MRFQPGAVHLIAVGLITASVLGASLVLLSQGIGSVKPKALDLQLPGLGCELWRGTGLEAPAADWLHEELGQQCSSPPVDTTIPRILHHVYFPNRGTFLERAAQPGSATNPRWADSCLALHPHWQHVFWGEPEAMAFIKKFHPKFLPTFMAYDHPVRRADALRPLVLHTFGGVYLDLDVECFAPMDAMLSGADLVLQGTGTDEPVTNGIMASRPGLFFWRRVIEELERRSTETGLDINVQTGPAVVIDTLRELLMGPITPGKHELLAKDKSHKINLRIWPLGSFFTPCTWNDRRCHRQLVLQRATGSVPAHIVGYHRYSASWHARGRNRYGILTEQDAAWSISATQFGF